MSVGVMDGLAMIKLRLVRIILALVLCSWLGCAGSGLDGGSSTAIGNPDDGSDDVAQDSLFEAGPIDIPVTIAKLEAPVPDRIAVTVQSSTSVSFKGLEGAIPNPSATPFVYVLNRETDQTTINPVNEDGSFENIVSSAFTLIASSIDELASQISAPVIYSCFDSTCHWILTNSSSLSASGLTMANDTVYAVVVNQASNNLSAARGVAKIAQDGTTFTIYKLGVGGTYGQQATVDFPIDEVFATRDRLYARSGDSFYISDQHVDGGGFKLLHTLDETETYRFARVNDVDPRNSPETYDDPWVEELAIITEQGLVFLDAVTETAKTIYTLEECETITEFSWDHNEESEALVYLSSICGGRLSLSGIELAVTGNSDDPWDGAWENRNIIWTDLSQILAGQTVMLDDQSSFYINPYTITLTEGDSWTTELDLPYLPEMTINDFDATDPDVSSNIDTNPVDVRIVQISQGEEIIHHILGTSSEAGVSDGGIALQYTTVSNVKEYEQVGDEVELKNVKIAEINTATIPKIELHPSGKYLFYCANNQLHVFFAPDGDVLQLTEGVDHCDESNAWKIDQITGNVVLLIDTTPEGSNTTQFNVEYIDPETDERFQ